MFEGFETTEIDTGEVTILVRHGGSGSPVLLLHGHPRTHATWHRVAPLLVGDHAVVCPDLRGYGRSSKPPTTADHAPYAKRAMAGDCLALMRALGHDRFAVVGHDRGAYVAFRLAMDLPAAVARLAILDAVPIGEALARCDARFAASWWHWFFLGQTAKPAERAINADPETWYGYGPEPMGAEAYADYLRAIHDPATVHAMCEDDRAGPGLTAPTTKPTVSRGAASPARRSSSGRRETTRRISTAIRSPSGATGRTTFAAARSTAATTWRRRRRKCSWPPCAPFCR